MPPDVLGSRTGMGETRGHAMVNFVVRWRLWLEWAGLRESEPDERVRLL
jgi:hypothetical protein